MEEGAEVQIDFSTLELQLNNNGDIRPNRDNRLAYVFETLYEAFVFSLTWSAKVPRIQFRLWKVRVFWLISTSLINQ